MHHGYGILDKAIDCMNIRDREDFRKFVSKIQYLTHTSCVYQKKIIR